MDTRRLHVTLPNGDPVGWVTLTQQALDAAAASYQSVVMTPTCRVMEGEVEVLGWMLTSLPSQRATPDVRS